MLLKLLNNFFVFVCTFIAFYYYCCLFWRNKCDDDDDDDDKAIEGSTLFVLLLIKNTEIVTLCESICICSFVVVNACDLRLLFCQCHAKTSQLYHPHNSICSVRRKGPSFFCIPYLKRVGLFVQKLLVGSQNFEIGSSDPGYAHLVVVLYLILCTRGPFSISIPNLIEADCSNRLKILREP